MQVVLSTNNEGKKLEIADAFAGSGITILSLAEAGIVGKAVEDGAVDGATLRTNALKKARFAWKKGRWAMADDTGLFADEFNGKPGVDTADWNGGHEDTEQKTLWILEQFKDVENRLATFKTVAALISPEGEEFFFEGEIRGQILKAPRGKPGVGMPYRTIFQPVGHNKVWAEMTVEEENAISHRGQAFKQARAFLETLI